MKRTKKWFKSPAGVSVGTTVLAFILSVFYDFIKSKPVLTTTLTFLYKIWKFLISILNFQLKVWWVLLGIAVVFFILYIVFKVDELKHSEPIPTPFLNYTKDKIQNWKWEWSWEKQYDGKYSVEHLRPICPHCDTPLVNNYYGNIECPRCNHKEYQSIPNFDTVKTLIIDNIRKGLIPKNETDE